MRRFEVARKLENGEPLYRQNVLSGMAEPVTWDVADEDMPEYATLKSAGADFRAAEDVIIPTLSEKCLEIRIRPSWEIMMRMKQRSLCSLQSYTLGLRHVWRKMRY